MAARRPMTVSPLWLQGSILTFIFGFAFLAFSAVRIYQDSRRSPSGSWTRRARCCSRAADPPGPGAIPHLRPDAVRDRVRPRGLPRSRLHRRLSAPHGLAHDKLYGDDEAAQGRTRRELQANRYDPATGRWSGPTGRSRPSTRSTTTSAS